MNSDKCVYCEEELHLEGISWVDNTGGDCCSGDDNLVNENQQHELR